LDKEDYQHFLKELEKNENNLVDLKEIVSVKDKFRMVSVIFNIILKHSYIQIKKKLESSLSENLLNNFDENNYQKIIFSFFY
jgi:hypothetical protein